MKKTLLFSLLLSFFSLTLSADFITNDGIYYSLENGEAAITQQWRFSNKPYGDIVIPEKVIYHGVEYVVTSVANDAFLYCDALTSVTLPNSITSLGDYCFRGCNSLTSITLPNSITSLGNYCFWYCEALTSITLPKSITSLGESCFR